MEISKLSKEMREWGEQGLIPKVHDIDLSGDVAANILKVVREHIEATNQP